MTLHGFRARNHPQQVAARAARAGQTSLLPNERIRHDVDDRATPPQLFEELHAVHQFTVDAAASARNAKLQRFWTVDDDGLAQSWAGERVWCNPPYSDIRPWVEKASEGDAELVVMILPANRTEQSWWHDLVEPHRDHHGGGIVTRYLRGRLRFDGIEHPADGKGNRPPFGCVLLGWGCAP